MKTVICPWIKKTKRFNKTFSTLKLKISPKLAYVEKVLLENIVFDDIDDNPFIKELKARKNDDKINLSKKI